MHDLMRLIQLARGSNWAMHRPARVQDYITSDDWQLMQGLDLRDDFWQLPQDLDLRSADGHRAMHISGLALNAFILKLREYWITWTGPYDAMPRPVQGLDLRP